MRKDIDPADFSPAPVPVKSAYSSFPALYFADYSRALRATGDEAGANQMLDIWKRFWSCAENEDSLSRSATPRKRSRCAGRQKRLWMRSRRLNSIGRFTIAGIWCCCTTKSSPDFATTRASLRWSSRSNAT